MELRIKVVKETCWLITHLYPVKILLKKTKAKWKNCGKSYIPNKATTMNVTRINMSFIRLRFSNWKKASWNYKLSKTCSVSHVPLFGTHGLKRKTNNLNHCTESNIKNIWECIYKRCIQSVHRKLTKCCQD